MTKELKTIFALLASALAISSCTSASHFAGPSGEPLVSVSCNGYAQDFGDCMSRVSAECPNGYRIIGGNSAANSILVAGNNYSMYSGGGGTTAGVMISRTVLAVCN